MQLPVFIHHPPLCPADWIFLCCASLLIHTHTHTRTKAFVPMYCTHTVQCIKTHSCGCTHLLSHTCISSHVFSLTQAHSHSFIHTRQTSQTHTHTHTFVRLSFSKLSYALFSHIVSTFYSNSTSPLHSSAPFTLFTPFLLHSQLCLAPFHSRTTPYTYLTCKLKLYLCHAQEVLSISLNTVTLLVRRE